MPPNRETILVVDDESIVRRTLRNALLREGYAVLEAEDGVQALTVYRQHGQPIDLLLTDVAMPQMDGCELAEHLATEQKNLRVLFISGHTGAEILRFYGIQPSDIRFLEKPFTRERLLQVIREVLERPEAALERTRKETAGQAGFLSWPNKENP
jgi:two-component system cell cycle sensor histidine kinase/response regulator CckA